VLLGAAAGFLGAAVADLISGGGSTTEVVLVGVGVLLFVAALVYATAARSRISTIDSSVHDRRKPPTTSRTSSSDSAR
jgi:uncharacterized membrane protein